MTVSTVNKEKFGLTTRALAGFCYNCSVCVYANRRPESTFGRVMEWHRSWCPAWAAHTKVHGLNDLSA
jgi:hypothetical protein